MLFLHNVHFITFKTLETLFGIFASISSSAAPYRCSSSVVESEPGTWRHSLVLHYVLFHKLVALHNYHTTDIISWWIRIFLGGGMKTASYQGQGLTSPCPKRPWVSTMVMTWRLPRSIWSHSYTSVAIVCEGHHAPSPISSRILPHTLVTIAYSCALDRHQTIFNLVHCFCLYYRSLWNYL